MYIAAFRDMATEDHMNVSRLERTMGANSAGVSTALLCTGQRQRELLLILLFVSATR